MSAPVAWRAITFSCLLMSGGSAALCATLPIDQAAPSTTATSVPFTFIDNRMLIRCTIDGKGPFAMVVDTGSPDVVVDTRTAIALGARVRSSGTTSGAGNKVVQIGATELDSLSIGSRTFRRLSASVIDLSEIRTKLGFPRLDGIVGYSVMKQFAVFVDVDASTISFLNARPLVPPAAVTTAFTGIIPIVPATIDGIPTMVVIDTGDRSSLTLFGPFAKAHRFYGRFPSRSNVITGYGVGGPVYGDVFTLPSLSLFGRRFHAIATRASRQTAGVFTGVRHGGSVGEGVLKRLNMVYDYPRKQILAWPSKYFATPDRFHPPPKRL